MLRFQRDTQINLWWPLASRNTGEYRYTGVKEDCELKCLVDGGLWRNINRQVPRDWMIQYHTRFLLLGHFFFDWMATIFLSVFEISHLSHPGNYLSF
jgi:hypothetical protein